MSLAGRIAHRKTPLSSGTSTVSHKHKFFSFYFVKGIRFFQGPRGEVLLPERAMVVVLPFAPHAWSNRGGLATGCVYDLTPAHAPHVFQH
jgi:hypothetical protein